MRHLNRTSIEARVRIDGGDPSTAPSISNYPFATQTIGTPSVRTGLREDVYLTLVVAPRQTGGVAVIGVNVQPLVVWLWIGGGFIALGTLMSALPGRRRDPMRPVSEPVPVDVAPSEPATPATPVPGPVGASGPAVSVTTEDPTVTNPPARRPGTARWVAVAVAVVMVAFLVVLATRKSAESVAAESPLLGRPAPEVIGTGLDGRTVRLSEFRGRYVLLNFFASWCVPCAREHDDLLTFQSLHAGAGDATVLAVLFDDQAADAKRFFAERGGDWPVITDAQGKVSLDFGVRGPPESFLISPDGIVLSRVIGEVDARRLEVLLQSAKGLDESPPETKP